MCSAGIGDHEKPLRERNGASAKKEKEKAQTSSRSPTTLSHDFYGFIPSITYSTISEAVLRLKISQDQSSEEGTS